MKIVNFYLLTILLMPSFSQSAPKPAVGESNSGLINGLGIQAGINFPFGSGVLQDGAYPIGLSLYPDPILLSAVIIMNC